MQDLYQKGYAQLVNNIGQINNNCLEDKDMEFWEDNAKEKIANIIQGLL